MQSIAYLPASNGSANASLMTVTNIRSAGANTIKVNTVANASTKFTGTMGTPHTFTDPVTSETITIISEASAVDFFGSISGSDVVIDQIAAGYTDLGSKVGDIIVIKPTSEGQNNLANILGQAHADNGAIKSGAINLDAMFLSDLSPSTRLKEAAGAADFVVSGGVLALVSALTGSLSNIVYYINGNRYSISSIANKVYTASRDTYVDVNTSQAVVYTEVANGAAAPALLANHKRLGYVVSSGAALTIIRQVGFDSLGNRLYNTVVEQPSVAPITTLSASADQSFKSCFWKPKDIMTLGTKQPVLWQPYPRAGGSGTQNFYRISYFMRTGAGYVTLESGSGVTAGDTANYQSLSFIPDEAGKYYNANYDLAPYSEGFLRVDLHRDGASGSDTNPNPTDVEGIVMFYNKDYSKSA